MKPEEVTPSEPSPPPVAPAKDRKYKRVLDLTILVIAHVVLFPIWLLIWTLIPLAIWLQDRGPVFFKQQRMGAGGKIFTIRKFRTMVPNADKIGPSWNTTNDPRVTKFGRLLRRTGFDELPQVLNIWRGEMSFVGPRSLDVDEYVYLDKQVPGFSQRLAVPPGLTGLAQLYDHTDDAATKLRFDLEYIRRRSLWLDVKILFLSWVNTLSGRWDRRSGKPKAGKEHRGN